MRLPGHSPRTPVKGSATLVIIFGIIALAGDGILRPVAAQERPDSVQAELERLRERIDSLEAVLARIERAGQAGEPEAEASDELARLRAAAEAAAGEGGARPDTAGQGEQEFVGRQRGLQALNPEISANVDVFGHLNTDDVDRDNFVPREFEFSFQSALDPFSRAKIFLTHHASGPETVPFEEGDAHLHEGEGEEGGGVELEEGYVEWVGLPAGLTLKVGKFFQRFGALNRWHAHALPHQSRSLPHLAFIGEESLAQAGASVTWLLPLEGAGTWDATVEVTRSSNANLFGESNEISVLGHLNGFWQLTESTDLDLGLSWIGGDHVEEDERFARNLFGLETALTWRPPSRSRYRELVVRGGAMLLDGLDVGDTGPVGPGQDLDGDAVGVWSLAELRLDQQWYVGGRFDWVENPADPDESAWIVSPTLTWWQSEWVRLRLEYDLLSRSFLDDDEGRLWLQITFAMGPHKHETY